MKIAYIYLLRLNSPIGVLKKIEQQAEALDRMNDKSVAILVYNLNRSFQKGRLNFIKINMSVLRFLYYLLFRKYRIIEKYHDLTNYDYLILRYPLSDRSGIQFMKKYKVILEFHCKDVEEIKSKIKESFLKGIYRLVQIFIEMRYARKIINGAYGINAMSDELRFSIMRKYEVDLPSVTIENGIDIKNVPVTGFKEFNNHELNIVFIGSNASNWHGLDRLIVSRDAFLQKHGNLRINLHFVGNIDLRDLKKFTTTREGIYTHGPLYGEELNILMKNMHLAVCPLSLYRKNLNEVSAIKVCEYMARGIPFIIAYDDPNLKMLNPECISFLKFPNDNSIIDFELVLLFLRQLNPIRDQTINCMRRFAEGNLDWTIKMSKYVNFVKGLK